MAGTLERAIAIAAVAHEGQVDKAGSPYVLHPLRTMLAVRRQRRASQQCCTMSSKTPR